MNAGEFERRQVPSLSQIPELSDNQLLRHFYHQAL